jgi:hypothetical protein
MVLDLGTFYHFSELGCLTSRNTPDYRLTLCEAYEIQEAGADQTGSENFRKDQTKA